VLGKIKLLVLALIILLALVTGIAVFLENQITVFQAQNNQLQEQMAELQTQVDFLRITM